MLQKLEPSNDANSCFIDAQKRQHIWLKLRHFKVEEILVDIVYSMSVTFGSLALSLSQLEVEGLKELTQ